MKWFDGGIAQAIAFSKSKGSIFVVYIEGTDEKSQEITASINSDEISNKLGSDDFVAIKLEANSVPHQQFSEIYKQTSVPSIYFIAKNGVPLEIVTEATGLSQKINEVLIKSGKNVNLSENFIKQEQQEEKQDKPKPDNVVCENGVCTIKKETAEAPSTSQAQSSGEGEAVLSAEEKVDRAKKLLEIKRLEKEQEEQEKERQKEIERRKMGQSVQQLKKWQDDQELKNMMEERQKEKRELAADRARVLAQIEQDKAERAARFSNAGSSKETPSPPSSSAASASPRPSNSNTARLQFKLPDGSSRTKEFPSSDTLDMVIAYIKDEMKLPFSKFSLSMTFPRRDFTTSDYSQTLADLQLTPNAVILILPLNQGVVQASNPGGLSAFVWTLLSPFLSILNFLKAFVFGIGGNTGNQSRDKPPDGTSAGYSGGSRTNSVIHIRSRSELDRRLRDAGSKLVVMDFFATWCGPCKMIAPYMDQLAKEYRTVIFLKIDVDENPDIAQSYGVQAMPTFVFLKNRREVARFSGADQYQLRSIVGRYR